MANQNPINISGFGTVITFIASNTFPAGLPITQFADDADPIVVNNVKIGDTSMGLNGDLQKWQKAVAFPLEINVVPGSADDVNLQLLLKANLVQQGKNSANDVMSATILYPDKSTAVFTLGAITDGPVGQGVQSSGRKKTKGYSFMFGAVA